MKNIRRILGYLGRYKKYAILAPVTVSLEVLLEIWIPYLMADIIDVGIANKDTNYVVRIGGLMALFGIIWAAINQASHNSEGRNQGIIVGAIGIVVAFAPQITKMILGK